MCNRFYNHVFFVTVGLGFVLLQMLKLWHLRVILPVFLEFCWWKSESLIWYTLICLTR